LRRHDIGILGFRFSESFRSLDSISALTSSDKALRLD
jgi:hypothetical protein